MNGDLEIDTEDRTVLVRPGDYIIGDLNGVVCLRRDLAGRASEVMLTITAQNEKFLQTY